MSSSTRRRHAGSRRRGPPRCAPGRTGPRLRARPASAARDRRGAHATAACSRAGRTSCRADSPGAPTARSTAFGPRSVPRSRAPAPGRCPTARRRRRRMRQQPFGRSSPVPGGRTTWPSTAASWSARSSSTGPGATGRVLTRVSAENASGRSSAATWATIPPTPTPPRWACPAPSVPTSAAASAARSRKVYAGASGSSVVDAPQSRRSYRTTHRPADASRSQSESGHDSIVGAPANSTSGSSSRPNASMPSSTPFACTHGPRVRRSGVAPSVIPDSVRSGCKFPPDSPSPILRAVRRGRYRRAGLATGSGRRRRSFRVRGRATAGVPSSWPKG